MHSVALPVMFTVAGFIVLCVIALARSIGLSESSEPQAEVNAKYVKYNIADHHVIEFQLADGTRCVLRNVNGIACEWKPTVIVTGRVE